MTFRPGVAHGVAETEVEVPEPAAKVLPPITVGVVEGILDGMTVRVPTETGPTRRCRTAPSR